MYPYDIPIRDFCMIAYYVGICETLEILVKKRRTALFASSKLPLFDQFARFDLGSILRKLEEGRYLLATAQMIGNGQQPFAISLAHSSP